MQSAVSAQVKAIGGAAKTFGPRLEQALSLLKSTFEQASLLEGTPSDTRTSVQAAKLDSQLGLVDDIQEALSDTDVLYHHITAIAEATAAFSWVVADDPVTHLKSLVDDVNPPLAALRAMADPSHAELANAVDAFLSTLSAYVARNPAPLNFITVSSPSSPSASPVGAAGAAGADAQTHTAAHLADFRNTVSDATVNELSKASEVIPGLTKAARPFITAVNHVYHFIVTASQMAKAPSDDDRQELLQPIIDCIVEIQTLADGIAPSDASFNHVKAIADATSMLSWIVADSTPTSFVTDAETTAAFYLNKVLMTTKRDDDAAAHKRFVDAMNALFAAMRAYIKAHFATGLRYGLGVAASGENTGTSPCAVADTPTDNAGDAATYVTGFKALITGPLATYVTTAKGIGGIVGEQAVALAQVWEAEAAFLSMAVCTPKPTDIQPLLTPVADKLGRVAAFAEAVDPRGEHAQHVTAVSESVAAMGWIAVSEKATAYVGDMSAAGQFFIDKVKMQARKTGNPQLHRDWAASLENLWKELKAYVKEFHTQALVWNPPKVKRAAVSRAVGMEEDMGDVEDYVTAFDAVVNGSVAAFVNVSKRVGGSVAQQAAAFGNAWKAEANFLKVAIKTPKPDDIQPMLKPIADEMGAIGSFAEAAGPRDALSHHLNAVSESMQALGWVAVEEKATVFVADSAGAGQFFIDKVKIGAKKTGDAQLHRDWAAALETCWSDLKSYVKEHHTQKLVWNPPKRVQAARRAAPSADMGDDAPDYVSAFHSLVEDVVSPFAKTCDSIGGDVAKQGRHFLDAFKAEEEFLGIAIKTAQPDDVQGMLGPIASKMEAISGLSEAASPRDAHSAHLSAVSESMAALGWVAVPEKATVFVGDMAGAGQFYIDKVKMGAKKMDNTELHREWAKGLEKIWTDLKAYVKEYHTQKLMWNVGVKSARKAAVSAGDGGSASALGGDCVSAFEALMNGRVAKFVQASEAVGGDVAKQAHLFSKAMTAEGEFIKTAQSMKKPDSLDDMVAPIAALMGEMGALAEGVSPRDAHAGHLSAVSESMQALGWIMVDEKATVFVGDMAAAGQFYIDKVKMAAKRSKTPEVDREWAACLEGVWSDLKAYVKEFHTQKLTWKR